MNKTLVIIGLVLLILAGIFFGGFFAGKGCNKQINQVKPDNTVITLSVDTCAIIAKYSAELKAELSTDLKPVEKWKNAPAVNVDSIYVEAKRYWEEKLAGQNLNNYTYLAHGDTTFNLKDSGNVEHGTVKLTGEYFSPFPLHPDGKIRLGAEVKLLTFNSKTTAQETVVKKELPELLLGGGYSAVYDAGIFQYSPFVNLSFNKKIWFFYWLTEVRNNIVFETGKIKLLPQLTSQMAIGL